eukprot:gene31667-6868_t
MHEYDGSHSRVQTICATRLSDQAYAEASNSSDFYVYNLATQARARRPDYHWAMLPNITIRRNTSFEASDDLSASPPSFDPCTTPLVVWTRYPYNMGETFSTLLTRLSHAIDSGMLSPVSAFAPIVATPHGMRLPTYTELYMRSGQATWHALDSGMLSPLSTFAPIMATPYGMQLPTYTELCMRSLFHRQPITLAELSSRDRVPRSLNTMVDSLARRMRSLLRNQQTSAPPQKVTPPLGLSEVTSHTARTALGVGSTGGPRSLLASNRTTPRKPKRPKLPRPPPSPPPPPMYTNWTSARCLTHTFGNMLDDMAVMQEADLLLEIRPFGMPSRWASRYFFQQLRQEGRVHWYGINVYNRENSLVSSMEEVLSPLLNSKVVTRENSVAPPMEEVLSPLLNPKVGAFSVLPYGGSPQPSSEPQGGGKGVQCTTAYTENLVAPPMEEVLSPLLNPKVVAREENSVAPPMEEVLSPLLNPKVVTESVVENSVASPMEEVLSPLLNPKVVTRERSVKLPVNALFHHMHLVASVGRGHERYQDMAVRTGSQAPASSGPPRASPLTATLTASPLTATLTASPLTATLTASPLTATLTGQPSDSNSDSNDLFGMHAGQPSDSKEICLVRFEYLDDPNNGGHAKKRTRAAKSDVSVASNKNDFDNVLVGISTSYNRS